MTESDLKSFNKVIYFYFFLIFALAEGGYGSDVNY